MENYNNEFETILINKLTNKQNRKQIIKMIGLAALWVAGAYASMYAILVFFVWFNNDFLKSIYL